MAEAEPTIRYTERAGKSVVEVGGTWTVFSVRGIREKAEKALQAAGAAAKGQRTVDATGLEKVDTAGALEILELAGGGPRGRGENPRRGAGRAVQDRAREHVRRAPRSSRQLVGALAREIGRGTIDFYKQVIKLCAFFGEILVVVVEAILQPKRFRPSAVVRQMYEVWIRALVIVGVLCFLIGVVIAYQACSSSSSLAPRPSPSRRSGSECSANLDRC